MDNYKKKNLKFSGMGRNIRAAEMNAARGSSRLERFSLLRPIDDDIPIEEEPKEKVPCTRIPTFGIQKPQTLARKEMLKKWKDEKLLKKKIELETKKPPFKVGFAEPNRFGESARNQESGFQSLSKTLQTPISKRFLKSKIQPCFKPSSGIKSKDVSEPSTLKSEAANTKFQKFNKLQAANSKPQAVKKVGSDVSLNPKPPMITNVDTKGSKKIPCSGVPKPTIPKPAIPSLLPPRKQLVSNIKPKAPMPASQLNSQASKSKGPTLSNRSNPQPSTSKLKGPTPVQSNPQTSITRAKGPVPGNRSNPQTSTTRAKEPVPGNRSNPQTSTTRAKEPVPGNRSNPQSQPNKLNKPGVKSTNPIIKSANPVQVKQPVPAFKKAAEKSLPKKVQPKKAENTLASEGFTFPCQISSIDLAESEKSFAPKGFLFCPPALEASWSFLDEHGPCAIFARIQNEWGQNIRTSTPKSLEWNECEDKRSSICDVKTSFTGESSTVLTNDKTCTSDVPSSETKYIECLLDNSPDVKLPVPISPKNELLEQEQPHKSLPLEEKPEFCSKVNCLETQQPEPMSSELVPLEIKHLQSGLKTDILEPTGSGVASPVPSSDTKVSQILSSEMESEQAKLCQNVSPEICLSVPNETKELASALCLSKGVATKIPDPCLLEIDQGMNAASEMPLLEIDGVKHSVPELSIEEMSQVKRADFKPWTEKDRENISPIKLYSQGEESKNNYDHSVSVMDKAKEPPSSLSMLNKSETDESVFVPSLSYLNDTKTSKRFTRSHRRIESSLVKISESPEIETPKSHRKKASACADFTPRRSRRLAHLKEFNSEENLFDVVPSFVTPSKETSKLAYDFEALHLESLEGASNRPSYLMPTRSSTTHNGKLSLLYTPPRRSTRIKSLRGDLMTFSPNV